MHIYLSEVLEWHADLSAQQKWDEKAYSPTRKKLLSALESISGYNSEALLKRLPADALYEERAILLGKMNQHELSLSLYVHKVVLTLIGRSLCCDFEFPTVLYIIQKSLLVRLLITVYFSPHS